MERVYADDTTVEALVGILEDNPRGLLDYKDELTGWIRGLDQYKGGRGNDRQFWLSIHTNSPVVVDRKSRQGDPVYLDHPFVTLAGGIQPAMLPELGGAGRTASWTASSSTTPTTAPRISPTSRWIRKSKRASPASTARCAP